jgi:hypothetical protein
VWSVAGVTCQLSISVSVSALSVPHSYHTLIIDCFVFFVVFFYLSHKIYHAELLVPAYLCSRASASTQAPALPCQRLGTLFLLVFVAALATG